MSSVAVAEVAGEVLIVSGGSDGTVRIWQVRDWRLLLTIPMASAVAQAVIGKGGLAAIALARGLVCIDLAIAAQS